MTPDPTTGLNFSMAALLRRHIVYNWLYTLPIIYILFLSTTQGSNLIIYFTIMENGGLHIAMLPWPAFGHLLPFLELSRRIAQKGHRISFICSPKNIQRLPKLPPKLVTFIEFSLPCIENLPENAEATIDLPSDALRPYLRKAYDSFGKKLSTFLQDSSPDWLLCDYAAYWAPRVAAEAGVPCAYLSLFNAATLAFFGPTSSLKGGEGSRTAPEQFTVVPDWVPFPSTITYRPYEAEELFAPGVLADESGVSESFRFGEVIEDCSLVAIRSCSEFEPDWLQLLEKLFKKPVIPVGFFPPLPQEGGLCKGVESEEEWASTFEWLDKQSPGSVVYSAFGSEVKLTSAQVHQIALGLEQSGLPFLWAVRAPVSWLPEGFMERTDGRGATCLGWVPQVKLLAHRSIGGFLTHGGWNSIIEGLSFGLAVVLLPLVFDQGLNARNLVERGLGIEVPREDDGLFTAEGIARSLRLVMAEEEGEAFRVKARECRDLFGDEERQDRHVREFLEYLAKHRP